MKLETNSGRKTGKFTNTFLNNQWVKKKKLENENGNNIPKLMRYSKNLQNLYLYTYINKKFLKSTT